MAVTGKPVLLAISVAGPILVIPAPTIVRWCRKEAQNR